MKQMDQTEFELGDSGIRRDYKANTWRVRVYDPATKKIISKYFADKKFGGREGAYKVALAFRNQKADEIRKADIKGTFTRKKSSKSDPSEAVSTSPTIGTDEKSQSITESTQPIQSLGNTESSSDTN